MSIGGATSNSSEPLRELRSTVKEDLHPLVLKASGIPIETRKSLLNAVTELASVIDGATNTAESHQILHNKITSVNGLLTGSIEENGSELALNVQHMMKKILNQQEHAELTFYLANPEIEITEKTKERLTEYVSKIEIFDPICSSLALSSNPVLQDLFRIILESAFPKEAHEELKAVLTSFQILFQPSSSLIDLIALKEAVSTVEKFFAKIPSLSRGGYIESKLKFKKSEVNNRQEAVDHARRELERAQKTPFSTQSQKPSTYKPPSSEYLDLDLFMTLLHEEKYDLLSFLTTHNYEKESGDKTTYHFLLDKTIDPMLSSFEGAYSRSSAIELKKAYERYLEELPKDAMIPKEKRDEVASSIKSLIRAFTICAESEREDSDPETARKIHQAFLRGISPLVVNVGCNGHAVALALYQEGKETRALLFNTGLGIRQYHPTNENKTRFQTYIEIANIPSATISESLLLRFINANSAESIDTLYEEFSKLEPFGKKMAPSSNPLDYEMPQMSGTCSAQCKMAFSRYHHLKDFGGASLESMGLYKLIKARTLTALGSVSKFSQSREIRAAAQSRMNEIALEIGLSEIAKSSELFQETMALLDTELRKRGLTPPAHPDTLSQPSKFYLLQKNLRLVAKLFPPDEELPELGELNPLFDLLLQKRLTFGNRLFSLLEQVRSSKDVKKIEGQFKRAGVQGISLKEWLEEDFKKDPPFWTSLKEGDEDQKKLYKYALETAPDLFRV